MPPSRSEKSKAALKPQPTQRFRLLDVEYTDDMEVDTHVTTLATQPAPPTPQPTPGSVAKALPPGLNFSKAVTDGTSAIYLQVPF